MSLKVLTEASGSLTAGYIIKSINKAGHISVASDAKSDVFGRYLAHEFVQWPQINDPNFWDKAVKLLKKHDINVFFPSLDETLMGWSKQKELLKEQNINIILSNPHTIEICQDKWLTYLFFKENDIPTPESSLEQDYPLVKPRNGRGSVGVQIANESISMENMISQELLKGTEYTIDVLCDRNSEPIYIIPRKRLGVKDGKSVAGVTVLNENIINLVKKICFRLPFIGPVNLQCFELENGEIKFLEINPRLGGGMSLGFEASDNWVDLAIRDIVKEETIGRKEVKYGLKMMRYYEEVFVCEEVAEVKI
jgi:carbamoyl-phosphate synthase large subunit